MTDEEVVIVDDDGAEHVFPPGFDPRQAASIVREKTYKPGKLARHIMGGDIGGYPEGQDNAKTFNNRMAEVLEPLAHPQSAGDVASMLLPQGIGKLAGRLLPSKLSSVNVRGPVSNAIGVAADAMDNPAVGLVSPRMPYAGKMLRGVARMIEPAKPAAAPAAKSYNPLANMGNGPRSTPPPPAQPVRPQPATAKPSFSSQDVLKIKLLMQQGMPQDKAIELVKAAVQ